MYHKPEQKEKARQMAHDGATQIEISRTLGVSKSSIQVWCHDITMARKIKKPNSSSTPNPQNVDKFAASRDLLLQNVPPREVAKKLGISRSTVYAWHPDLSEKSYKANITPENRDKAREMYAQGQKLSVIVRELAVPKSTVIRWCKDLIGQRQSKQSRTSNSIRRAMTDEQVIAIRNEIRSTGVCNYQKWVAMYGLSHVTIGLAAKGVSYSHLNEICPPIEKGQAKRIYIKTKLNAQDRRNLFQELCSLVSKDPGAWTLQSMADWMKERAGGTYLTSHISSLIDTYRRELRVHFPKASGPKRNADGKRVYRRKCAHCQKLFETLYTRTPVCDEPECQKHAPKVTRKPSSPRKKDTARTKSIPDGSLLDTKGNPYWENECVMCEKKFRAYSKDRDLCNSKECREAFAELEKQGMDEEVFA